jgi:hypothetical protein
LSVSAQFNVDFAEKILEWTTEKLNIISGLHDDTHHYTVHCLINNDNRHEIIQLIKKLDLGIAEIQVDQRDFTTNYFPEKMPDELKKLISKELEGAKRTLISIGTSHRKFDADGNYNSIEEFNLKTHESERLRLVADYLDVKGAR